MFEHVTILLSFVYAVALTHLLSSATELLIARRRVRFSGLYALWLVNVLLFVVINWVSLFGLVALKRWTMAEVVIQFVTAVAQYFACSTFRITEARDEETIDLPALYQQRRSLIFGALLALDAIGSFQNWWDRDNMAGLGPNDWIGENLVNLLIAVLVVVGGWTRPKWLQWAAAVAMFGPSLFWLTTYALPAG